MQDEIHVGTKDLANKVAHVLSLDGGAHALFNSLEIYHEINLLEQIREYNTLYQLMQDTGVAQPELDAHFSISDGMAGNENTRHGKIVTPICALNVIKDVQLSKPTFAARIHTHDISASTSPPVVATSVYYEHIQVAADKEHVYEEITYLLNRCGNLYQATSIASLWNNENKITEDSVNSATATNEFEFTRYNQGGVVYDQTQTYTFSIPLMSGILDPQMSKYIPVGSLAADLRLELGISPFELALVSIGGVLETKISSHVHDITSVKIMGTSTFVNIPQAREAVNKVPIDRRQSFAIKNLELQLE